jgi:hypothetical protein
VQSDSVSSFPFFSFLFFFWEGGGFFSSFGYIHVAGENEMKGKWEHKRKSCGASTPCTVYNSAKKKRIFAKFCNSHALSLFLDANAQKINPRWRNSKKESQKLQTSETLD